MGRRILGWVCVIKSVSKHKAPRVGVRFPDGIQYLAWDLVQSEYKPLSCLPVAETEPEEAAEEAAESED